MSVIPLITNVDLYQPLSAIQIDEEISSKPTYLKTSTLQAVLCTLCQQPRICRQVLAATILYIDGQTESYSAGDIP